MMMKKFGTTLWSILEGILEFIIYRILHINLPNETWDKLMQFVKFVMVGLSNVIVSYVIYLIFFCSFQIVGIFTDTDYLIAQLIGYVLSIFWSFYWNRKYVFTDGENFVPWYKQLIKSFIAYSFTGVFLNSLLSFLWVEIVGIAKTIAPIINLIINVPVNFLINKYWAFSKLR